MQLQQKNQFAKSNLLRKCGLLAHTSAAFLKNCCTEKLFSCLRLWFYSQHHTAYPITKISPVITAYPLTNEEKQKSKRELKESQLQFESGGCNEIQGFRGNCDFQGKLGMCPSLAEPDSRGFSKKDVSNHEPQANKSFLIQQFFKNVGEVWASSPHLRSKLDF